MKRVLIIGASSGGQLIAEALSRHKSKYHLAGIMDADPEKHGKEVAGVKVLGGYDHLEQVIREREIDEVIVAIANLQKEYLYSIVDATNACDVTLRIIPSTLEKNAHDELFRQLRTVNAADLLGRPSVALDQKFVQEKIRGKTILVTGAAGSIGSEIIRQILNFEPEKLVAVDINENDLYFLELHVRRYFPEIKFSAHIANIREKNSLLPAFELQPDMVFHAAAHKHVPLMEASPLEAIRNNIQGTLNVLDMTVEFNVSTFVLVSTDKAVNPTNVMGASKRLGEKMTAAFARQESGKFMSVRFGNVLGSKGSVIPIFKTLIEEGQDLTVTHEDATRYFMTIPEAAQLVIEAGCRGEGNELFVLDMGNPVRIMNLAEQLIKLSGLEIGTDINIRITGLRPGEKLHEELFYDPDAVTRTENPKILKTANSSAGQLDLAQLRAQLDREEYRNDPRRFLHSYVETYEWGES